MRIVYYGGASHAAVTLVTSLDRMKPLLVVARPDRPRGRGLELQPSMVRVAAESHGVPVVTPARAGTPEEIERIRALSPDLLIVVAYGQILPPALLAVPRLGALNIHYSLLPRWRGAAPVQAAILAGDAETGVSIMWMSEGLDEGPVFLRRAVAIGADDTAGSLLATLGVLGTELLVEALDRIERGDIVREEQDARLATYARKMGRADGRLVLTEPAPALGLRVRATTPEPGAWLDLEGGPLAVLKARADEGEKAGAAPGTVRAIDRERGLAIACGSGALWLGRVRPAGRKEMSGADYANGARLRVGDVLKLRAGAA